MFAAIGRLVYRFRWPVILVWVGIVVAAVIVTATVPPEFKAGGFNTSEMESIRAAEALRNELNMSRTSVVLIFSSEGPTVDDAAFRGPVEKALAEVKKLPNVQDITSYYNSGRAQLVSTNRRITYATVGLDVDPDNPGSVLDDLKAVRAEPLKVIASGDMVVYADMDIVAHRDLVKAETITFPLVLVVLLLIFGTAVAAGLPVAMGAAAVTTTLAALYLLTRVTDLSIFSMNVSSMLGLGLGIDYSLLLVSRFREELARDGDVRRSIEVTVARAGKAVFFSGIIVFIGLSGLRLFSIMVLYSLAYGGMIVVALSVLAALTLVPAVLGALGPRVNRLAIRRVDPTPGVMWQRLARGVMRHPVIIFVAVIAIVLVLASPFSRIKLGVPDASILPADMPSRQGADILKSEFGAGDVSPVVIVLRSDTGVLSPSNVAAAYDFTKRLESDRRVKRVDGLFNVDARLTKEQIVGLYASQQPIPVPELAQAVGKMSRKNITFISVIGQYPPMSDEARRLVEDIRTMRPGGDLRMEVGGMSAVGIDLDRSLYGDFPRTFAVVVAATFVALLILFRSVVLPLKAVIMNMLSIGASYGALVFVFQEGNFSNILGFAPQGHIDTTTPIMLFCLLFGLSMDYEVFLLTRVKEAYDRTGNNEEGIVEGLERTGRIITSAAAVMVVVTGSFAAADMVYIKAIGFGTALAILLDATIIRALLVPATMRLLGDWNWWAPRFIRERRAVSID